MKFSDKLKEMYACSEAVEWVGKRGLVKAWRECKRPDWMLWLLDELGICERERHELACDFAESALIYVPDGEDRPRIAIETKRKWLRGEATDDELAAASAAARAAWIAASATESAARAAASAAAWAAAVTVPIMFVAWAARAAASAAARAAQCDMIRKRIPLSVIKEAMK